MRKGEGGLIRARGVAAAAAEGATAAATGDSDAAAATAPAATTAAAPPLARTPSPPPAGARALRDNPPNTVFRRLYERGDLPVSVDHKGFKNAVRWRVDPSQLDYHHYLPVFFDGVRERQDPYRFLAVKGVEDLLAAGGARVLPVVPQLVIPIKTALNTRDPAVMCVTLQLLQKLVACADLVGEALVPYFRQILPVLNTFMHE